jgi:hypothetical protein
VRNERPPFIRAPPRRPLVTMHRRRAFRWAREGVLAAGWQEPSRY